MLSTTLRRAAQLKRILLRISAIRGISQTSATARQIREQLSQTNLQQLVHARSSLCRHRYVTTTAALKRDVNSSSNTSEASSTSSSSQNSNDNTKTASTSSNSGESGLTPTEPGLSQEPKMAIAFTCTVEGCGHRQAHMFTKRSYERGIVIVTCSNCHNRHLIADHLGWFKNLTEEGTHVTIEKLAKLKGDKIMRGSVDVNGVLEYSEESSQS